LCPGDRGQEEGGKGWEIINTNHGMILREGEKGKRWELIYTIHRYKSWDDLKGAERRVKDEN